jgi:hypothetical protein
MITQHWGPVLIAPGHHATSFVIMGHVASVRMRIRVYSKTLVLWPTTRNARAGSQSTIHPKLTRRRRARATYRTHGPRWADRNMETLPPVESISFEHATKFNIRPNYSPPNSILTFGKLYASVLSLVGVSVAGGVALRPPQPTSK